MVTPLEAFCDAIMAFEGWEPGSRSNRNRNPGNLRPTSADQPSDAAPSAGRFWQQAYRTFVSLVYGYQALLDDVSYKVKHHPEIVTVLDLLNKYAPAGDHNNPSQYAAFVVKWINKTLDKSYTVSSTIVEVFGAQN